VVARYALDHQACLITGDFGFADVRNYAPASYHGIVVLELPRDANAKFTRRFHYVEDRARQDKVPLAEAGLERLDGYWNEVRAADKTKA